MRTILLGTAAAAVLNICAAEAADGPVEEVLITARLEEGLPQELALVGNRVETITAEEVLNQGYVDIGQALQNQIPGLYIAPLSGAFDYIDASYQGSRTPEMLWLIDGVRINNRLYSTTTPIDTVPAHMVERIEVLEGGQALFYGTQAVAGAINVVTKEFSNEAEGRLEVGVGSDRERHINGYFRDALGPHQVVLFGSSDQAEGFQPFPDEDYQDSATDRKRGYDVFNAGAKYGITFGDARVSLSYQHTTAKLDFLRPTFIAVGINERLEDIAIAKLDWAISNQFEFYFKGYYHWWDAYYTEYDNVIGEPGVLEVIDDRSFWGFNDYGLNFLGKYVPGNSGIELYGGYDFQNYNGRDDVFLIGEQTESVHAPFAQIRTTDMFLPNLRLAAGVRHNMPSDAQSSTVWNVSGHYDVTPNLFLRGSAGTAFRLPDAYELYVIDPCCEQGNPNLEAEESINFNGSIGGRFPIAMGTAYAEAVGFYRKVSNRIEIVFDEDLGVDTFANSGPEVTVKGGELIAGIDFGNVFSATFSYSFNSSEAEGTDVQLPDVPESLIKASFDYHPMTMPFGVSATLNHVGDVYRNAVGRQEFGGYTVVDLGARVFLDQDRRHRIGASVQNLFDTEYTTRVRTTTPDDGGPAYPYHFLGTPQTFRVNYSYSFGG